MLDCAIVGGTLVTAEGTSQTDLGVLSGKIVQLGRGLHGRREIDASGMLVLPGAVDEHVHLELPVAGTVSSDDFYSGTVAAAFGGTTTVLDFVEPAPGQPLEEALGLRRSLADPKVTIDYGLHMTLSRADPATLAQIPGCMRAGSSSFKLYMAYEGLWLNDGALLRALEAVHAHSGRVLVHAENHHAISYLVSKALASGHIGPDSHAHTRPTILEAEAIHRLLALAEVAGSQVMVAHVSCAAGLAEVQRARSRGQTVWIETCPHYLTLDEREYSRPGFDGAKFVVSPPLRTEQDRNSLWAGLAAREVDTVATDHCPFFFSRQKTLGRSNFSLIPGGAPGIETRLMLLYELGVRAGRLAPERWVEVCCTEPARRFGLAPRKGTLAIGADADIVVWDPGRQVTLSFATLHQNTDYTPYEGLTVQGSPVTVLVRGRVVVDDGRFLGEAGQGRFLRMVPARS
ncbi:MAG TPA: dihydropyrimidinase [Anaerolineae bacterium]|nr:dihydropyrimidinase [Anaerolineae bacterium]